MLVRWKCKPVFIDIELYSYRIRNGTWVTVFSLLSKHRFSLRHSIIPRLFEGKAASLRRAQDRREVQLARIGFLSKKKAGTIVTEVGEL